jgi:hypothetical protein
MNHRHCAVRTLTAELNIPKEEQKLNKPGGQCEWILCLQLLNTFCKTEVNTAIETTHRYILFHKKYFPVPHSCVIHRALESRIFLCRIRLHMRSSLKNEFTFHSSPTLTSDSLQRMRDPKSFMRNSHITWLAMLSADVTHAERTDTGVGVLKRRYSFVRTVFHAENKYSYTLYSLLFHILRILPLVTSVNIPPYPTTCH